MEAILLTDVFWNIAHFLDARSLARLRCTCRAGASGARFDVIQSEICALDAYGDLYTIPVGISIRGQLSFFAPSLDETVPCAFTHVRGCGNMLWAINETNGATLYLAVHHEPRRWRKIALPFEAAMILCAHERFAFLRCVNSDHVFKVNTFGGVERVDAVWVGVLADGSLVRYNWSRSAEKLVLQTSTRTLFDGFCAVREWHTHTTPRGLAVSLVQSGPEDEEPPHTWFLIRSDDGMVESLERPDFTETEHLDAPSVFLPEVYGTLFFIGGNSVHFEREGARAVVYDAQLPEMITATRISSIRVAHSSGS